MLIEATGGNVSSPITMTSFSSECYHGFLFPRGLQYSHVDPILDNILETLARINTMILGVVILTINVFSKLLFVGEFLILRKSDKLLLHKDFPSLCHIKCILNLCFEGL